MGLYNFQKRFVPFILSGAKTHTIRALRAHPDKPGDTLHLYTGLRQRGPIIQKLASGEVVRQKMSRLLMRVECVKVEEIVIHDPSSIRGELYRRKDFIHPTVEIDGEGLHPSEMEALAKRDGFHDFEEMIMFWDGRLPFRGHIIHWRYDGIPS